MLSAILVLILPGALASCPFNCQCSQDFLSVKCINASLQIVPLTLHPEIHELILKHNRISEVGPASFQFHPELKLVNLQYSGLNSLQDKTFDAQRRLTNLLLDHNNVSELNELTFSGLQSLKFLDLSFNNIKSLPDNIFYSMSKLEHLSVSNNYIKTLFPAAFVGLNTLETLNLDSNKISSIPRDLLKPISNLTNLELSNNKLIWANLQHLKKLKYLTVSGNQELNLSTMESLSTDLSTLESLSAGRSLIYLDLSNTHIFQIPNQINLFSNLETLKLNQNNLTTIQKSSFRNVKRLKYLEINENQRLSTVEKYCFSELSSLEYLSISSNPTLISLDEQEFTHLKSLQNLILNNNGFQNIYIKVGVEVSNLDLSDNPWLCDCKLQPLQRLAVLHNLSLFCAQPHHTAGQNILEIDISTCDSTSKLQSTLQIEKGFIHIIIILMALTLLLCFTGLVVFHFRTDICKIIGGNGDAKSGVRTEYAQDYQDSFIQHEQYFLTLHQSDQDDNKHIPVTEL